MAGIGVAVLIDDTAGDGSLVYTGYASKGVDSSATDASSFAIKRTTVDTTTTTTQWAADGAFNQVWDDRSSLTYK